ncbi:MAG: DNA ligase [Rhodocyclaceae bacterium]|nr:DNA ligase [Rhodocyclaceae bacterium]MBK6905953.1 DNA ligase [Rhodocyclaceae bacterium]
MADDRSEARWTAPASAPAIVLAQVYRAGIDPAAYLVSEKFDGVRAVWDGQVLRFRSGNPVNAPAWFIAALPPEPLDGELWLGRSKFDRLSGIVRTSIPDDAQWRQISYLIFEAPGHPGDFTERAAHLAALTDRLQVPWLRAIRQQRVADDKELLALYQRLIAQGAEGMMLHRADAPYVTGRSDVLLKLKPVEDAEATVVGYVPGRGKLTGKTGALLMETAEGKQFALGSGLPDALRRTPPPLGTRITYRYQELTATGVPRFPRFWRVRETF